MKRLHCLFVVLVVLFLAMLAFSGCGVSKSEYAALQTEYAALQTEYATLKAGNDSQKAKYDELCAQHETLQAEKTALAGEKKSLQAKYDELCDEREALQAEKAILTASNESLKADYNKINTEYETAKEEVAEIKKVYPPRGFSSVSELQDWLRSNDISERTRPEKARLAYSYALELQEDALKDGYIVSARIYYDTGQKKWWVSCSTVIDGDMWLWGPTSDEPKQVYTSLGKLQ